MTLIEEAAARCLRCGRPKRDGDECSGCYRRPETCRCGELGKPLAPDAVVCPNCIRVPAPFDVKRSRFNACKQCGIGYDPDNRRFYIPSWVEHSGRDHDRDRVAVWLAMEGASALGEALAMARMLQKHGREAVRERGKSLEATVYWGFVALRARYPREGELETLFAEIRDPERQDFESPTLRLLLDEIKRQGVT